MAAVWNCHRHARGRARAASSTSAACGTEDASGKETVSFSPAGTPAASTYGATNDKVSQHQAFRFKFSIPITRIRCPFGAPTATWQALRSVAAKSPQYTRLPSCVRSELASI